MTDWQLNTPVVLIIFNRPDTTAKVFEAIRQAKPPQLLVIADGPRPEKPGEAEKCAATRAIIDRIDWDCEVIKNYSEINLGCQQRVASGLDWVFQTVETAIILEDDCLPHPTFFRFCAELLVKYRHEPRVMAISGDNFQFGQNRETNASYYFSRYPHCWGWATWRRAWQHYDAKMKQWPQVRQTDWLQNILLDIQAVKYWSNIFEKAYSVGLNTWDYAWTFTCWMHQGLTILPHVNLVSNIGFGTEATHTKDVNSILANMPVNEINFPLVHPPAIIRNILADDLTEKTVFSGANSPEHPYQIDLTIAQAVAQLNAQENAAALQLLNRAIAALPKEPGLHYGKAIALARMGQNQAAIESLNILLAAIPEHPKARQLLREIQPGSAPGISVANLVAQANQAINTQNYNQAFDLLNQAKKLQTTTLKYTPNIDYLRGICFLNQNQPGAALQALQEELRYFPQNTAAQTLKNQILAQYPQLITRKINDPEFQQLLAIVRPYTMLSEARLYSLFSLVKEICQKNIPGNIVECGVAGGGSTALMAAVIQRYSKQPRWLYAFDSFSGMPAPTEKDRHQGIPADKTGWGTGTCAAPETTVQEICSQLGVRRIVKTVKGYFQETLPKMRNMVGMISLLHVDGDWYESTRVIFQNLYDRVVNDGYIQVDDYGHWEGCRQAVHEFAEEKQITLNLQPIDETGVFFVKPDKFPLNPMIPKELIREFYQDDPVAYGIESQMSLNERFQLYYVLRHLLPQSSSPLRFVEIGSYAGSSLFLECQTLKRIVPQFQGFAIDPGGHPQLQTVLQRFQNEVTYLPMLSHQAAPQLQSLFAQDGQQPVFIFVDGDHSYEGVRQDILNYFPLLAPGGIMIFHDYLPPLNDENRRAILFHHGGKEPGIRQACQELMEKTYSCEQIEVPLLYPTDPTQTQAHLPIIPGVFSTLRVYRKLLY